MCNICVNLSGDIITGGSCLCLLFACSLLLIILTEFSVSPDIRLSFFGVCAQRWIQTKIQTRYENLPSRGGEENKLRILQEWSVLSSKELVKGVKGNTEGNRIKISLPGPMKKEWKWRNCFFKVPLCQFINFNFLDTGEVESLNFKAQSDQNHTDFRFYLYPAFKNE